MLGAPVGSFLFGIFDYQTTFFFFSGLVLGVWFMILIYIPNKLGADDAETDKSATKKVFDQVSDNSMSLLSKTIRKELTIKE